MKDDYAEFLTEVGITQEVMDRVAPTIQVVDLPDSYAFQIRIGPSQISGLGVFSTDFISKDAIIGPAQIKRVWTTLGRYANHAKNSNCRMEYRGDSLEVVANCSIGSDEELTVNYRQVRSILKL